MTVDKDRRIGYKCGCHKCRPAHGIKELASRQCLYKGKPSENWGRKVTGLRGVDVLRQRDCRTRAERVASGARRSESEMAHVAGQIEPRDVRDGCPVDSLRSLAQRPPGSASMKRHHASPSFVTTPSAGCRTNRYRLMWERLLESCLPDGWGNDPEGRGRVDGACRSGTARRIWAFGR